MKRRSLFSLATALCIAGILPASCFGQSAAPLPRFGIEVNAGTLGAGIQAATAVTHKSNVRFGFNYFSYSASTTSSGTNITFDGKLKLESGELLYDQYLFGGFHISPGLAMYYGNQANGTATIPAGQTVTLNSVQYYSSASVPITGTGSFTSSKFAPEVMFGFGNLLPRSARHFTLNFDMGVVFVRSPLIQLNLVGNACTISATAGCSPIATTPTVESNLMAEQTKLNNTAASYLKYWPVIRLGFVLVRCDAPRRKDGIVG
jgi:hypothetical protein